MIWLNDMSCLELGHGPRAPAWAYRSCTTNHRLAFVRGRTMADRASDLQLKVPAAKGWDPHFLAHEHVGSGPRSARRTLQRTAEALLTYPV